jgi:hypothetical protein
LKAQSGLGRITSSIAIERLRVLTQPRPEADIGDHERYFAGPPPTPIGYRK